MSACGAFESFYIRIIYEKAVKRTLDSFSAYIDWGNQGSIAIRSFRAVSNFTPYQWLSSPKVLSIHFTV